MGFNSFSSNGLARAFSVTETRLLPVGHLTSGVYIICVEQSNDRITRKILLP